MALYVREDLGGSTQPLGVLDYVKSLLASNPYASMNDIVQRTLDYGIKNGSYREALDVINGYLNDYYTNLNNSLYDKLRDGSMTGTEAQRIAGQTGLGENAGLSDVINNQIAQDNAATAYEREIAARDTSLTSTINQLQNAGMNPGSAISIGGSALGNVGQAASVGSSSPQLAQQAKINEYNQKQRMTRQLISMAGSLAAAGIGGASYGLARGAAVKAATATVGSAKTALNGFRKIVKDKGHEDDPDSWYL